MFQLIVEELMDRKSVITFNVQILPLTSDILLFNPRFKIFKVETKTARLKVIIVLDEYRLIRDDIMSQDQMPQIHVAALEAKGNSYFTRSSIIVVLIKAFIVLVPMSLNCQFMNLYYLTSKWGKKNTSSHNTLHCSDQ